MVPWRINIFIIISILVTIFAWFLSHRWQNNFTCTSFHLHAHQHTQSTPLLGCWYYFQCIWGHRASESWSNRTKSHRLSGRCSISHNPLCFSPQFVAHSPPPPHHTTPRPTGKARMQPVSFIPRVSTHSNFSKNIFQRMEEVSAFTNNISFGQHVRPFFSTAIEFSW